MGSSKSDAVVLGLGGANALGVVRSLGYEGIPSVGFHMGDRKSDAHHSKYMDRSFSVGDESGLVDAMIDYGKGRDERGVVFPTGDDYVSFCSRNRDVLSPYFLLPESSVGDLSDLIEKEVNFKIGERAGFMVPRSVLLGDYSGMTGGPVIVKPLNSVVGGKGDMRIYGSDGELLGDRDRLLEKYGDMLVQEFVPGDNRNLVGVHVYKSSKGVVVAGMQRNELSINVNPSVHLGVAFKSIWEESLVEPSVRLANQVGYNGVLDIDLKQSDHDGQFHFMEVNIRTGANLLLDTAEGVNAPAMVYRDLTGGLNGDESFGEGRGIGGTWIHEARINRFLGNGGSRERLLDLLENVKARVFYDSTDMGPFDEMGLSEQIDSEILEKVRCNG